MSGYAPPPLTETHVTPTRTMIGGPCSGRANRVFNLHSQDSLVQYSTLLSVLYARDVRNKTACTVYVLDYLCKSN
jgi:hypothetical protein